MRVLIVDDDFTTRFYLGALLGQWGFTAVMAGDGREAWEILQREPISIVICDWMMPNMDGPELCRVIRAAELGRYVYIILLTTKDEKAAFIGGMDAGADDFIVKPVDQDGLSVRLRAARRVVSLQEDLYQRNQLLAEANDKLSLAYQKISEDLKAAAKAQTSLLPPATAHIGGAHFQSLFVPSAMVSGDTFNYFPVTPDHIGLYGVDVAGHGVRSALVSVMLSRMLTPDTFLKDDDCWEGAPPCVVRPSTVVSGLNQTFQSDMDSADYFTMVCAVFEPGTGRLRLCQAGHPYPILLPRDGAAQRIGTGGFPVGMLPDLTYEDVDVTLRPGDRLVLYSDGVTECANAAGEDFGEARLLALLEDRRSLRLDGIMAALHDDLRAWNGTDTFNDDISVVMMEPS